MCLILFAYKSHPDYRLILAANRDEFLNRPTAPLGFHFPGEKILCGLDLQAGGTWLAVSGAGRIAGITNYRDPARNKFDAPSRGDIVLDYLRSGRSAKEFLAESMPNRHIYNGFNLLLIDLQSCWYSSNAGQDDKELIPGVYGLSNRFLDTPWPKLVRGKELLLKALREGADPESILRLLGDDFQPPEELLPDTGVGLAWEKTLAPIRIHSPTYGTRSSAVILVGYDQSVQFVEQTWEHGEGIQAGEREDIQMMLS
ncbi:NRDE family protein [Desulfopila sp. IMCC35008]|uniref:NRDE family protein n=1 Tax=Desulfopila sp. IMCC35008 TaxID=2653858 RepID=UPI0013D0BE4C|nr:NRDE family protein [Desulfopila sp. IMCC35008]